MLKSTVNGIRALLDEQRVLALAVDLDGVPYAGLLPFAVLPDRSGLLVNASKLARHSQGLSAGARAGVLIHEQDGPDKNPMQIERLTFECVVHPLERDSAEWEKQRDGFLEKFPKSRLTFKMRDFTLYRLTFRQGLYVAGFGQAIDIEPGDIAALAGAG
jgi:putative heme iron utilization protein